MVCHKSGGNPNCTHWRTRVARDKSVRAKKSHLAVALKVLKRTSLENLNQLWPVVFEPLGTDKL